MLREFKFKSFDLFFNEKFQVIFKEKNADIAQIVSDRDYLMLNPYYKHDGYMTPKHYDFCLNHLNKKIEEWAAWNTYSKYLKQITETA